MRYAVFLRGINVGGHKTVVMAQLTKALEALGCTEVKTLLNSGNVVLTSKIHERSKRINPRLSLTKIISGSFIASQRNFTRAVQSAF